MKARPRREGGYATAEFALTLPAVILVLTFCLAVLGAAGLQLRAEDAARAAAREAAIGSSDSQVSAVVAQVAGESASVSVSRGAEFVTAVVRVPVPLLAEWGGAHVQADAVAAVEE